MLSHSFALQSSGPVYSLPCFSDITISVYVEQSNYFVLLLCHGDSYTYSFNLQGNSQPRGKANGSPKVETPPPSVKASPPTKPVTKPVIKLQKSSTTPSLKRRPESQSGPSGDQVKRARMKSTPVVSVRISYNCKGIYH